MIIPYLYAVGAELGGRPSVDFMCFWSAAVLGLQDPASAYDATRQIAFQASALHTPGRFLPFLYPPHFLALVIPFGLLPFAVAYPAWVASTYGVYLAAARRLLPIGAWPIAVFPALYVNAVQGQTGALFAGLFIVALLALPKRPILAGLLFGALTFKPQLGIVIPVALIAGGYWRTLGAACLSAMALLLGAALLFGPGIYAAFLHANIVNTALAQTDVIAWAKEQTLFGAARQLGAAPALAGALQGALTIACATGIFVIWRSGVDLLRKGAVLATGALLCAPHALDYDFVLLIVPICYLAREGLALGFPPWRRLFLAILFFAPIACRPLAFAAHVNPMPLLIIGLFWVLTRPQPPALLRQD